MTVSPTVTSIVPRTAPNRTSRTRTIHPVPKPTAPKPMVYGKAAQKLAHAQGLAFQDIAADLEAADASDVADQIDARRDALNREAHRLVRLARHDPKNAESYLVLADGCLCESTRLDRIHDEHRQRERRQIGMSIEAGRDLTGVHEHLLTGRQIDVELPWPLDDVMAPGICGAEREPMGDIRFDRCGQTAGHEQDDGVHVFMAVGPEGGDRG